MTVQELITMIDLESNEILDNSNEYIPYINAAIDYLSMILTSIGDRESLKNVTIKNNMAVPSDFMAFVPKSGYPIRIVNGSFQTYDEQSIEDVYYSVKKNHISNMTHIVPFSEIYLSYLVQFVSYLVKKKSLMIDYANYDKTFIDNLTQLIQLAKGV